MYLHKGAVRSKIEETCLRFLWSLGSDIHALESRCNIPMADSGFPRRREEGEQPIIWHNFHRKLNANKGNGTKMGTRVSSTPPSPMDLTIHNSHLLYGPLGYKVHAKWFTVRSRVVRKLVFQLYTPLTCTGKWWPIRMLHVVIHVNICLGSPFPSPAYSHTSIRIFERLALVSLSMMEICAITRIDCIIIAGYGDGFVYGRESDTL